jgi:hypothetical protein
MDDVDGRRLLFAGATFQIVSVSPDKVDYDSLTVDGRAYDGFTLTKGTGPQDLTTPAPQSWVSGKLRPDVGKSGTDFHNCASRHKVKFTVCSRSDTSGRIREVQK